MKIAIEDFKYIVNSQAINANSKTNIINGQKEILNDLQKYFPHLDIHNFQIQTFDSKFNLKPFIIL